MEDLGATLSVRARQPSSFPSPQLLRLSAPRHRCHLSRAISVSRMPPPVTPFSASRSGRGCPHSPLLRPTSRAGCQPPGPGRRHSVIGQRNLTVPLSEEWTWAAEMGLLSHGPPPPRGDARRSGRRAASARPDGTHAQGRSQRTGCAGTRHHTPSGCKGHDCIASRLGQSARTQVSPGSVGAAVLSGRSGGRHPCSSSRRGRQNPAACGCRADVPVF